MLLIYGDPAAAPDFALVQGSGGARRPADIHAGDGGFYLLDVDDLDVGLAWAAKAPIPQTARSNSGR